MAKWSYTINGAAHDEFQIILFSTFFADGKKYQDMDLNIPAALLPKIQGSQELEDLLAQQVQDIAWTFDQKLQESEKIAMTKDNLQAVVDSLRGVEIVIS